MLFGKMGTAKTQLWARNASGSIGRSAASPLTATAALRFAPCRFPRNSICRPAGALCFPFSVLRSPGRQGRPNKIFAKKSCMPSGNVLSYVPFFTARVVKWHTRMLEVHVERSVGVRVPPRAPSQRGRRKAVFLFFYPLSFPRPQKGL